VAAGRRRSSFACDFLPPTVMARRNFAELRVVAWQSRTHLAGAREKVPGKRTRHQPTGVAGNVAGAP
jgi:hypothetical protein